jgi:hypothetical protein
MRKGTMALAKKRPNIILSGELFGRLWQMSQNDHLVESSPQASIGLITLAGIPATITPAGI